MRIDHIEQSIKTIINKEGSLEELFRHSSLLFNLIDSFPVPICIVNKDSTIVMINKVFTNYLGKSQENAIGKHVHEVDKSSRWPEVMKAKKSEEAWKHTFSNDQTAVVHRLLVTDDKGEILYGVGVLLFETMEKFQALVDKNHLLESEIHSYKNQLSDLYRSSYSWEDIIGTSPEFHATKELARKASHSSSTVLLLGESGTGKELFAHSIHGSSPRKNFPFVKLNSAAIPSDLLESELFGYEEGAFTGARKGGKIGKFELADKGTLFLDEISEMSMEAQVKLLRILQEGEVERLGANRLRKVDVRIIAATNQDLQKLVKEKKFREDLYYRLNVFSVNIPPLKKHPHDIGDISKELLRKISMKMNKNQPRISDEALDILKKHDWPGNVRELENTLERAMNLIESDVILPLHLPPELYQSPQRIQSTTHLSEMMDTLEKDAILHCLMKNNKNKAKTARDLGISRSSLYDKMQKYHLLDEV